MFQLPTAQITGTIYDTLLMQVSILGILLVVATALRLHIPVFKKYYIPSALIAGVLGLLLGPYFLGIISTETTSSWSAMSGRLITLLYAPMFLRRAQIKGRDIAKNTLSRALSAYFGCFTQYAIPLLLGAFILGPVFGVNDLFACIVEQGWSGGHGSAGGAAIMYEELNWLPGQSLSVTSATIGLFIGIIGGVIIVNIGVRRGWTNFVKDATKLENNEDELYSAENAPIGCKNVMHPNVMDGFAFHLALMSVAVFIGYFLNKIIKATTGLTIAWYACAMFGGLFVKFAIRKTKWYDAIDNGTINRIQGIVLDFMIACSVASVNVPVVIEYAFPLLIQQSIMLLVTIWTFLWLTRRVYHKNWFEQSCMMFGMFTGVASAGLLLLRMVDPDMESGVIETNASVVPFTGWAMGGGVITAMMPALVAQHGALKMGLVTLGISFVVLILMRLFSWYPVSVGNSSAVTSDSIDCI